MPSKFREWFECCLKKNKGRRLEWAVLLGYLIEQEFCRTIENGTPYAGGVFPLDRANLVDIHSGDPHQHLEPQLCYRLYREVYETNGGILEVGGEPIWIVNLFVPNQLNIAKRSADILGLRTDGSLVVFEAKRADMGDSPFYALLEGLDYLSHLLVNANQQSFLQGFEAWRERQQTVPAGFENVGVTFGETVRHSVIVLAPAAYYFKHMKDSKRMSQGWEWLSERLLPLKRVRLDYAISDFSSAPSILLPLK